MMQYVINLIARCGNFFFDFFINKNAKNFEDFMSEKTWKKCDVFDKMRKLFHFFNEVHKRF